MYNLTSTKNLVIFTVLLFLLNFLSKLLKEVFSVRISVYPSTVLKLSAVVLLSLYFMIYLRTKKFSWFVYVILIIFGVDLLMKITQDIPLYIIYNRLYFFLKGFFFFVFITAIIDLEKNDLEKPINVLLIIGELNLVLILTGVLFDINIFQSYPNSGRFGFNGIIAEPGFGSCFYILLVIISYFRCRYQNQNYLTMIFMLVALVLLGTKSGYLFIGVLILIHILYLLKRLEYQISFIALMVSTK